MTGVRTLDAVLVLVPFCKSAPVVFVIARMCVHTCTCLLTPKHSQLARSHSMAHKQKQHWEYVPSDAMRVLGKAFDRKIKTFNRQNLHCRNSSLFFFFFCKKFLLSEVVDIDHWNWNQILLLFLLTPQSMRVLKTRLQKLFLKYNFNCIAT